MEEFVLGIFVIAVFVIGVVVGNTNSTNDIMAKQIIEANTLCSNSEGLYKINSGDKHPIAYCKNNDKFDFKEL